MRVLEHVGEALLDDPVRREVERARQRRGLALDLELDRAARSGAPPRAAARARRGPAGARARRRPTRAASRRGAGASRSAPCGRCARRPRAPPGPRPASSGSPCRTAPDLQHHHAHRVGDDVVQLARDPRALLGDGDPRRRLALALGLRGARLGRLGLLGARAQREARPARRSRTAPAGRRTRPPSATGRCRRRSPRRRARRRGRPAPGTSSRRLPSRNAAASPATKTPLGKTTSRPSTNESAAASEPDGAPARRTGSAGARAAATKSDDDRRDGEPAASSAARRAGRRGTRPRARSRSPRATTSSVEAVPAHEVRGAAHGPNVLARRAHASYLGRTRHRRKGRARTRPFDDDARAAPLIASRHVMSNTKGTAMHASTTARSVAAAQSSPRADRTGRARPRLPPLRRRLRLACRCRPAPTPASSRSRAVRTRPRRRYAPTAARSSCARTGTTRTRA